MEGKPNQYSEAVVGYVLIKRWYQSASSRSRYFIDVEPITIDYEGIPSTHGLELDEDDVVLGILPAIRKANRVFRDSEDGSLEPLGYEFEGAYVPPDWCAKTIKKQD